MKKVYLGIGGNMGDRSAIMDKACTLLQKNVGKIISRSSIYETAAWGNTDQPDFLNQVIIVETASTAKDLLRKVLKVEESLGRVRSIKNAPRNIDIDILFYGASILNEPGLSIPHPEISNRRFVLIPLAELSPELKHPVSKKTIKELLNDCTDDLEVKLWKKN